MFSYEIYTVEKDSEMEYGPKKGDVRVKFPEMGLDFCTEKDEMGHLYFGIPNYDRLMKSGRQLDRTFVGCIHDAIESIQKGYGDALSTRQMFGPLGFNTIKVIRFEDRVYGEEMRQKTIDGWKDAVFGWRIECGNGASFSGLSPLCKNNKIFSPFFPIQEQSPILFFDKKEDGEKKLNELMNEANVYADKYFSLSNNEKEKYLDVLEDKIGFTSVIFEIFYDIVCSKKSGKREYRVELRQAVKQ